MIRRFVKAHSGSPFRVVRASVGTKSKEVCDVTRKPPVFRLVLITALVLMLALVPAALAAKGGNGGSSGGVPGSLALVMVNDQNGNGLPNWGDSVTFKVSTTATTEPHVSLGCYQDGVLVYSDMTGYYAGYPWPWTQIMSLWSYAWSGGAADCTAKLYYFSGRKTITLTTLGFHVDA
jgi:hypothetical protein